VTGSSHNFCFSARIGQQLLAAVTSIFVLQTVVWFTAGQLRSLCYILAYRHLRGLKNIECLVPACTVDIG